VKKRKSVKVRNKINIFKLNIFAGILIVFFAVSVLPLCAQVKLVPQRINLKNGETFNLNLPADYEIIPAAENLKRVRFFAKSPDGRIFVTDMHDLSDNKLGAVYILDAFAAETGKFGKVTSYMTNLRNPNSVQFYTDASGQDWIYLAETDKLTRRKFTKGETKPSDLKPQTIATFPDYGLSYKYGGWHLTRTIAFSPAGKLYVSVGSSCNACDEKEAVRAAVLEMDADGSASRIYAKGLRNAVDLKWIGRNFFATNQGSDHLGLEKPDETFYALKDGADYGWASCYSSNGKIFFDTTAPNTLKKPTNRLKSCADVPAPYAFFPAHGSALGFDYFDDADSDATIKNSFLVALHGSTDKRIGHGYKIVIVRKGEKNQDFINGFLSGGNVLGRPCGIMKLDANSMLFTDDFSGVIYYVRRKGATTKIAAAPETEELAPENSNANATEEKPKSGNCLGVATILFAVWLRIIF
jgi:glucose/arabinose dehydrogenase